jgi:hypothetical protein
MGFPAIPDLPVHAPTGLINPGLDYDFGPDFNYVDGSGVATVVPPRIKRVIKLKVPRVDADGNELGGVPTVLRDAPLGTYLGWNITASGFFKGQGCGFQGGYVPFPKTAADRTATHDPRLSVEERYGTIEGYMCVVRPAAETAVRDRVLLRDDAERILREAASSAILPAGAMSSAEARAIAASVCAAKR